MLEAKTQQRLSGNYSLHTLLQWMPAIPGKIFWSKSVNRAKLDKTRILTSVFGCFLTAISKVLFLKGRLDTGLYLHANLKFLLQLRNITFPNFFRSYIYSGLTACELSPTSRICHKIYLAPFFVANRARTKTL